MTYFPSLSSIRIGIKPSSKKDPRAFTVQFSHSKEKDKAVKGAAFSGITFLRHIGYDLSTSESYPIEWHPDDAVFTVQLSAEHFQVSQPLIAVEGGKKNAKTAARA